MVKSNFCQTFALFSHFDMIGLLIRCCTSKKNFFQAYRSLEKLCKNNEYGNASDDWSYNTKILIYHRRKCARAQTKCLMVKNVPLVGSNPTVRTNVEVKVWNDPNGRVKRRKHCNSRFKNTSCAEIWCFE